MLFGRTSGDCLQHGGVAEACGDALNLELELVVIDAARGVDGQHELEIGDDLRRSGAVDAGEPQQDSESQLAWRIDWPQ